MVNIAARTKSGESIGTKSFPGSTPLSAVFAWLAQMMGADASTLRIELLNGQSATGGSSTSSNNNGPTSQTVSQFTGTTVDDATVPITVEATAAVTDANERIRALFRQGAAASPPATSASTTGARAPTHGPSGGTHRKTARSTTTAADPDFDPRARAHLPPEEQARLAAIDENLAAALEFAPEQFGQVQMLFVGCEINKCPVTAFVDSGAQMSFMNLETAERCDLTRLIDKRAPFTGIAKGVGEQKIVGSIHMVPLNANGLFMPFSFRVLEDMPYDVIIGLDQLRRHQMILNLSDNKLHIGDVALPFLSEWEVAQAAKEREEAKKVQALVAKAEEEEEEEGKGKETTPAPPPAAAAAPATPPAPQASPPISDISVPVDASTTQPPPPPAAPAPPAEEPATEPKPAQLTQNQEDERIQQLLSFTGLETIEDARALLEAAGWDLEAAAALFFEG